MAEGIAVTPALAMNNRNISDSEPLPQSCPLTMAGGGGDGGGGGGGRLNDGPLDFAEAQRMLASVSPGAAAGAASSGHSEKPPAGGEGENNFGACDAGFVGSSSHIGASGHGRDISQTSFLPHAAHSQPNAGGSALLGPNSSSFTRDAAFAHQENINSVCGGAGAGPAGLLGPIEPGVALLAARERQMLLEQHLLEKRLLEKRMAAQRATAAALGSRVSLSPQVAGAGQPFCPPLSSHPPMTSPPQQLEAEKEELLMMQREYQLRRDLHMLQQHRIRMQVMRVHEQQQRHRQQQIQAQAQANITAGVGGELPSQLRAMASPLNGGLQHPGAVLSSDEMGSLSAQMPTNLGFANPGREHRAFSSREGNTPPAAASLGRGDNTPQSPSKIQQLLDIANQVEGTRGGNAEAGAEGEAGVGLGMGAKTSSSMAAEASAETPSPTKVSYSADGNVESNHSGGKRYGSPPGETEAQRKKRARTFAMKLMDALVHRKNDEAVAWLPDGKSFVIIDSFKFMREVYPYSFKECKYESFVRKLNQWGFTRLTSGSGVDCFSHKYFQRDRIDLVMEMRCLDWRVRRRGPRTCDREG